MRTGLLIGAGLAAMLALPAAADGYAYNAPVQSYSYDTQTATSSGCVTSCCCGQQIRTYTTRPVVRRYVQTYTRTAPPACTHTSHVGHDHAYYSGGYDYQGSASSYSSGTVTSGYAYDSAASAYGYADSGSAYGEAYYDDGYYGEDNVYYDAYPAPAPTYGAELSLDREAPWNGYHR
jgi:hypothetical protein